jgi:hypothetical protein
MGQEFYWLSKWFIVSLSILNRNSPENLILDIWSSGIIYSVPRKIFILILLYKKREKEAPGSVIDVSVVVLALYAYDPLIFGELRDLGAKF